MLRSLDSPHNTGFGTDDIASWPEGALDAFVGAGILVEGSCVDTIVCHECGEGCIVDVRVVNSDSTGKTRAFAECTGRDDIGRIIIPLERLRTWRLSPTGLAEWVARELGATCAIEEALQGRLWWLGGPLIRDRRADVFLAIGCSWPDAQSRFAHAGRLKECSAPLVIVPFAVPTDYPFGAGAKVLSLVRSLSLADASLVLDAGEIAHVIGKSRAKRVQDVVPFRCAPGTTWGQVVIETVTDEAVRITVGARTEHRSFDEMGFQDRRFPYEKPDLLWEVFKILAVRQGEIVWAEGHGGGNMAVTKKHISDLRKRLRFFFGIAADPFEAYGKAHGYKARFIIRDVRRASR